SSANICCSSTTTIICSWSTGSDFCINIGVSCKYCWCANCNSLVITGSTGVFPDGHEYLCSGTITLCVANLIGECIPYTTHIIVIDIRDGIIQINTYYASAWTTDNSFNCQS